MFCPLLPIDTLATCIVYIRAHFVTLPANSPERSCRVWSRNGREVWFDMLHDVIVPFNGLQVFSAIRVLRTSFTNCNPASYFSFLPFPPFLSLAKRCTLLSSSSMSATISAIFCSVARCSRAHSSWRRRTADKKRKSRCGKEKWCSLRNQSLEEVKPGQAVTMC